MDRKPYDLTSERVWVCGHNGLVGGALVRRLADIGCHILTVSRAELDLRRQSAVEAWVACQRPDAVFLAAATVGGIEANSSRPAEFLYDNIAIATNVIHASAEGGVKKLMFLGSNCFYPRQTAQPMREDSLLTGPLEPTNQWYAVAKIAGARLCQAYRRQHGKDFIVAVPASIYGPGDNFDPSSSHVVSALIRKVHKAKLREGGPVEIWGTGKPRREFLYVADAADALVFLMEHYRDEELINVGGGEAVAIRELAELVAEVVGYSGAFRYDEQRSDGMPQKQLDSTRLQTLGWSPKVTLRAGLARTYAWFLDCH